MRAISLTKIAGALAITSVALESNKLGVSQALESSKVGEAKDAIRNNIGTSKLNYESPKYNRIKEKLANYYPHTLMNIGHGAKGYLEGFSRGVINNIATTGFAILSICAKRKPTKTISLIGLATSILCNFLTHGTNLFERKDYLE